MFVIVIILLSKVFVKFATICSIIVIFQHSNVILFLLIS